MLSRHFSLQRFNIVDRCMIREFANGYISADPAVFQDVVGRGLKPVVEYEGVGWIFLQIAIAVDVGRVAEVFIRVS
jgi:hypothetical protein